jgi:hypothetical protein
LFWDGSVPDADGLINTLIAGGAAAPAETLGRSRRRQAIYHKLF